MQHGYSNILGELVLADVLEYGDCEQFQVVCPECREPVFKRVRDGTHFFSHYREDVSLKSECELRTRSMNAEDIEAKAAFARDQRLRYFLDELSTMLRDSPNVGAEVKAAREAQFATLRRSPAFKTHARNFWQFLNEPEVSIDNVVQQWAANCYEDWDALGWAPKTAFGREQQIRATTDLLRTLATPVGRPAVDKALNAGWYELRRMAANMLEKGEGLDVAEPLLRYLNVSAIGDAAGITTLEKWAYETKPPVHAQRMEPAMMWCDLIFENLFETTVGLLLSLDYMAALKRQRRTAH